jgi:hypothetical protein
MFPIDKSTIEFVMLIVAFLGGAVYLVAQAYNGRGTKKSDEIAAADRTVQLVNATREALEKQIASQNIIIIQQGKDIATLQAQLKSEKELNERYLQLIQNRNPELESYMKDSRDLLKNISDGIEALLEKPTVAINNHSAA